MTKAQLDRLGEALRRSLEPTIDEFEALQAFRSAHEGPLAEIVAYLRNLGQHPTSRIKTTNTIIEKLRCDKTRLSKVQAL